ncbi:MAG: SRPBCC family protein [Anaerolineae bacterium]|jgi:uncharacterized protein YndB with AHSA1/START domain
MEDSIVINRPVEEVFAYLTDVTNWSRWNEAVGNVVQTPPGPIGLGTTLRGASEVMGRIMEWRGEILEYEFNKKVVQKMRVGPAEIQASWIFEPVEGGTRLTMRSEGETSGPFKVAGPLIDRMVEKQIEENLARLKAVLEG